MQLALRPYVTTGVAIVGASVMVMAPIQVTPPDVAVPAVNASSAAVAPASVISDLIETALTDFNTLTVAGGKSVKSLIDSVAALPTGLAYLITTAIYHPDKIPGLLSTLTYGLVDIPTDALAPIVLALAQVLPPPLGISASPPDLGWIIKASAALGIAIGEVLDFILPTPVLPTTAPPTWLTNLTSDFQTILASIGIGIGGGTFLPQPPFAASPGVAGWVGAAPGVLLYTLQQAIAHPNEIPGYLSWLTYSLLAPPSSLFPAPGIPVPGYPIAPYGSYSLFTAALAPTILAWENTLPAPIGGPTGALAKAAALLNEVITAGLDILPAPNNPFVPGPTLRLLQTEKIGFPDTTPGIAIDALTTSTKILLGNAAELPGGVTKLVKYVAQNPAALPESVVAFNNHLIDTLQDAGAPLSAAAVGTLPKTLRPVAAKINEDANEALNDLQKTVTNLVTPNKPKKQVGALEKGTVEKVKGGDSQEPHRPFLSRLGKDKKVGEHRAGEGRVHVRDLVKNLKKKDKED